MRKECTLELIDDNGNVIPNNTTKSPNDVVKRGNDVIEVVRCKDCRWWNCKNLNYYHNNHLCRYWSKFGSINTSADDFCSYGERRGL